MSPSAILFVECVASALLQVAVFAFVPFAVFLISKRAVRGFARWIGLVRASRAALLAGAAGAIAFVAIIVPLTRPLLVETGTITGDLLTHRQTHGFSAWLAGVILVKAWITTGLSEEIFFRGFIAKRLIAWLGFAWGNAIQATLFGAIHLLMVFVMPEPQRTIGLSAMMLLGPGGAGWVIGYLNHHWGKGSILPGWMMHGLGNTLVYSAIVFMA